MGPTSDCTTDPMGPTSDCTTDHMGPTSDCTTDHMDLQGQPDLLPKGDVQSRGRPNVPNFSDLVSDTIGNYFLLTAESPP